MIINKTATYLRPVFCQEFSEGGDLGDSQAQDIESRIASALFSDGDDSVTETQDDAVIDDDQDASDEEGDLPEDDDADVDDDDVDADEPEADSDGDTLASVLGLDDDKLEYDDEGNVVFKAVIDGETQPVKIDDLVKSYQLQGHVNNKSIALENERKEFDSTKQEVFTELTNRVKSVNALTQQAEQMLLAEYQGIDWQSLRQTDPAEWTALNQEFQQRARAIEQIKQQANGVVDQLTEEQQAEMQQKQQQFIEAEVQKMIEDNPAWADQEVMAKEVQEIGTFLNQTYGFSPEEVANAMDSRLMKLIKDAHAFRSGKKAAAEKKVQKKVPKFRKPGGSAEQRKALQKARAAKATKQQIRKTGGSVDAVANAIMNRI
ncbi:putative scaffolding protein [Vibrio phage vB_ValP_VA-RY-3]|nr:putative scaffolding protein [Vibrio phage vB_ValP_VA-RY-3]